MAGLLGKVYYRYLRGNSQLLDSNILELIERFGIVYSET